jgi:hypothetical protein
MPILSKYEKPSAMPIGISNSAIDYNLEVDDNLEADDNLVPSGNI